MKKFNCPSCGAEVTFQSSVSVFAVCGYCRSMLVRQDMNLTTMGTMAELQDDASPLQLGTSGDYKGDRFTLVGRVQQRWSDGFWNEWYALFYSGRQGWLAEAQGFYMVSFKVDNPGPLPSLDQIVPDHRIEFPFGIYTVDDIKEVACAASAGELPFPAPNGEKSTSIDLSGAKKSFLNLVYRDGQAELYKGEYIDFDALQFVSLKGIDGW